MTQAQDDFWRRFKALAVNAHMPIDDAFEALAAAVRHEATQEPNADARDALEQCANRLSEANLLWYVSTK
jgi:hypothetical protein